MEDKNLEPMRHSCEHVLHQAMTDLYPGLKRAMGPPTEDGFYFDFDYDKKISEADFPKIEKRMREIINKKLPIVREEIDLDEAKKVFADNSYKLEWIEQIKSKGQKATVYWTGKPREKGSDVDLCKGPHVESTDKIGPFKLLSVAGAYWHGDEKNKMLTRIYGTCFPTKEAVEKYLWQLQEAKKRDHKKLGREFDLFVFSELVGPGLPLWTPKGTIIRELLNDFVWKLRKEKGYQKVTIPHITKKELYETSGHWAKFKNELFKITTREGHEFAMKPMNCPHHTQLFAHIPRSYKDMPQRYAETTMVYRDEQTGELSGLSRVRCITQDDAHVFCRKSQIPQECSFIWDIVDSFYSAFGFKLEVRLSLHDPQNMSAYLGTPELWNEAESALKDIADKRKIQYQEAVGEAAFYGPKIDFMTHDSLGREWQVATIQLDVNMPNRFDLSCVNEQGEKERIVMIHCAIMGSIERFMSILIEHYAGKFPLWLAPVQVNILPISDKFLGSAQKVCSALVSRGIRAETNSSNESIGKKIRIATLQKVPYMGIIGQKEVEASELSLSVRTREGIDSGMQSVELFISALIQTIENHA